MILFRAVLAECSEVKFAVSEAFYGDLAVLCGNHLGNVCGYSHNGRYLVFYLPRICRICGIYDGVKGYFLSIGGECAAVADKLYLSDGNVIFSGGAVKFTGRVFKIGGSAEGCARFKSFKCDSAVGK